MTRKLRSVTESNSIRVSNVGYGYDGESATDVIIRQGGVEDRIDFITKQTDVLKDDAKFLLEEATLNTSRNVVSGVVGEENAQDIDDIIRYGKKAKGSVANLATKAIDGIFGTSTNSLVKDLLNKDSAAPETSVLSVGDVEYTSLLAKLRKRADPQLGYSYRVFLPPLENATGMQDTQEFQNIFNYYSENVDITLPSFTDTQVFRGGLQVPYPMFSDNGAFSLTLYEDHHLNSTRYCDTWRELIMNYKTRLYNLPSVYKKPIAIAVIDSRNYVSMFFIMLGSFPVGGVTPQFNGTSSDPVKIMQEFRCNRIIPVYTADRTYTSLSKPARTGVDVPFETASKDEVTLGTIFKNPKSITKKLLRIERP